MPRNGEDGSREKSQTQLIAESVCALRYEDLPPEVVTLAKRSIADTLLVAAAGSVEESSKNLRGALRHQAGSSKVWFADDASLDAVDATFINTLHAAALDFDSLNRAVHADLVCLPAAWAVAEETGASGKAVLTAFIGAAEITSRLSRSATGPSKGWSGTSLYGGLGSATAAGKLMGLSSLQLRHALGLAASQASGTQQANVEQVLSKRLQPALAARSGLFSVRLARAGASAPAQALEGRFGLRMLAQPGNDAAVLDGLWADWQFLGTGLKRYPVCACSHAAVDACKSIIARSSVATSEIAKVIAYVSPFMARLVGSPFSLEGDPQVTAQFSLQYHLASILLRGSLGLNDIDTHALHEHGIADLIARIEVRIDRHNKQELAPASVEIHTFGGATHAATCTTLPGSSDAPLTDHDWLEKITECARRVQPELSDSKLNTLLGRIDEIETVSDMRAFWPAHKQT